MITLASIAITATYLLLDKYLPLMLSKPRRGWSWFGLRARTDP